MTYKKRNDDNNSNNNDNNNNDNKNNNNKRKNLQGRLRCCCTSFGDYFEFLSRLIFEHYEAIVS